MRATGFLRALGIIGLCGILLAPAVHAQAPEPSRCQRVGDSARFFWHYQCVRTEFERLQRTHPDIAKFYEIGRSVQGNPLYVLEVANFSRQATNLSRPSFYLDATHHGNEIQGTEAAMILARKVTSEYGRNATVTHWVDHYNLYINPVVNPDGNLLNQRYNANQVDLNRNYPYQHGARATQAGPHGASEPETQANVKFMRSQNLDIYLSLHTGTWDFVVPRCDTGTFRGRLPTDDEALMEGVLAELLNVTGGMGHRGASGTGESICWAYDVVETFSLLPEVSTEQSRPFTVEETRQLDQAMLAIYWTVNQTGRFGSNLESRLARNESSAAGVSVEITNTGLQVATNWTFELNYAHSRRSPLLRGNEPIEPGRTLRISIPKAYLVGDVYGLLRWEHLNVNPLVSDPQNGRPRDPHVQWLNFTQEEVERVVRGTAPPLEGAPAAGLQGAWAVAAAAALALVRRRLY